MILLMMVVMVMLTMMVTAGQVDFAHTDKSTERAYEHTANKQVNKPTRPAKEQVEEAGHDQ
jgi:regulatory protein YycH of two-component signal transduction system YycFG